MDTVIIFVLIIFNLLCKFIFVDDWVYDNLRQNHSKSFIKKNYKGIVNRIFYKDFYREIKAVYGMINTLMIFASAFLTVLLFLSFFNIDISVLIKICIRIVLLVCIIIAITVEYNMIFKGIDTKCNKISILSRIIYTVITLAIVAAFILINWFC